MGDRGSLAPIKGFIYKLLCYFCTSDLIPQGALCYLKAIHPKVPVLIWKENTGLGICGNPNVSSCIIPVEELKLNIMDITTAVPPALEAPRFVHEIPTVAAAVTVDALPSPLLCPQQTFLASLVFASKFT